MASSKCSIDQCKRSGDAFCDHCQSQICTKHCIEHIRAANNELIFFSDELNSLMETLHRQEPAQKALIKLEQWREDNHRRIDEIYEETKQRLESEMNQKISTEIQEIRNINEKIKQLIDEGDASFKQIGQIKTTIDQCRKRCEEMHLDDRREINIDVTSTVPLPTHPTATAILNGRLLSAEHRIKLNQWIGREDIQWILLYQASRDGFKSEDFHRTCDGHAPTVTIIESKPGKYLFGGYTTAAWHQSICYTSDYLKPFLFTLTNPHGIVPTEYPIRQNSLAIHGHGNYGPTFGGGHDIYVSHDSDKNMNNTFNFPHTYIDRTGRGAVTFTGSKNFQTNEIEVYQLIGNN